MGNGPEFFQTAMGHKFYEGTVPALVRELKRLNDNLEKMQASPNPTNYPNNRCKGCFSELTDSGFCSKRTCDYYDKSQP